MVIKAVLEEPLAVILKILFQMLSLRGHFPALI